MWKQINTLFLAFMVMAFIFGVYYTASASVIPVPAVNATPAYNDAVVRKFLQINGTNVTAQVNKYIASEEQFSYNAALGNLPQPPQVIQKHAYAEEGGIFLFLSALFFCGYMITKPKAGGELMDKQDLQDKAVYVFAVVVLAALTLILTPVRWVRGK